MGPKRRDWYLPVVFFLLSALIGSAQTPSSSKQKAPANLLAPSMTGLRAANSNFTLYRGLAAYNVALQAGSPVFQAVTTTVDFGNGLAGVPLSFDPGCCAFASATVANTGTADLNFASISTTGDFDLRTSPNGPPPPLLLRLTPGQSTSYSMTFVPTVAGPRTGTLIFQDDAAGSPHQVLLKGVGIGPGDFGIATADGVPSITVTAGQTATYHLAVTVGTGMNTTYSVSCSGMPTGAACSGPANAPLVGPNRLGGDLAVATTGNSGGIPRGPQPHHPGWWTVTAVAAVLLLPARRRVRATLLVVGSVVMVLTVVSCGGGTVDMGHGPRGPTPSGTFPFTVTATAGNTSRSMQLTMVVK